MKTILSQPFSKGSFTFLLLFTFWTSLSSQIPLPSGELYQDGVIYLKLENSFSGNIEYPLNGIPPSGLDSIYAIFQEYGVTSVTKPFSVLPTPVFDRIYKIYFGQTTEVLNFIADLRQVAIIDYSEQVPINTIDQTPSDPIIPYYFDLINANEAHDIHTGGNSIVAIIDDAFEITHEDLAANMVAGWDVADNDNDPSFPNYYHGTFVAGVAAGVTDNNTGIASIGWDTKIMPVKVKPDNSSVPGLPFAYEGVAWAAMSNADVINMSWGSQAYSQTNYSVIEFARQQGKVLVASAGNDAVANPHFPAAYGAGTTGQSWEVNDPLMVIAVASINESNDASSFTNFGPWVDVSAYGSNITTTWVSGGYETVSGTSASAPMAAGLIALMISYNGSASVDDIMNCMINAVNEDIYDPIAHPNNIPGSLGAGVIDAYAALACIGGNCTNPIAVIFPSSNTPICPNSSITLSTNLGISYLWSTGQTSHDIVVTQANTYSVTITFAGGCTASTSTVVNPPITDAVIIIRETGGLIDNDGIACAGGSGSGNGMTLTAWYGSSYFWNTFGGVTTQSISFGSPDPFIGTFSVTVTDVGGCASGITDIVTVTITYLPSPDVQIQAIENSGVPNDGNVCHGDAATLIASTNSNVTYLWSNGSTNNSIDIIANYSTTFYKVTVTETNGCTGDDGIGIQADNCECPFNSIVLGVANGSSNFSSFVAPNGPLPSSPTSPINVIFNGIIDIDAATDYNFPDGSVICMGSGALISVSAGKLTLTGTHIKGYDKMWQGIKVTGFGMFKAKKGTLNRTIIEDCEIGVIAYGGFSTINGVDFNLNVIGVDVKGIANLTPIYDCKFTNFGDFRGAFNGQIELPNGKTKHGVRITSAFSVSIGNLNQPSNIFDGVANGIFSKNSNITLKNSQFDNIIDDNLYASEEGHAVYAIGGGQYFRQGSSELCNIPNPHVTISNCTTGMYFSGMNIGTNKNIMNDVTYGIVVENGQNRRITICGNDITCNGTGISLRNNDPAQFIRVQSNDINVGPYSIPSTGGVSLKRSAISVRESGADQQDAVISGNTNINIFSSLEGISMDGCNGYVLNNNFVHATHSQQAATYFGIKLNNCIGLTLDCNSVDGNYNGSNGNSGTAGSTGIRVTASPDVFYKCNTLSDTRNGVQFDMGCQNSVIKRTNMNNHYYGLNYFKTAWTSPQPQNLSLGERYGNNWQNIGASGARHEDQGINDLFRNMSRYEIYGGISSNFYPINPSPSSDWIGTSGTYNTSCFNQCPIVKEECCSDLRVSDGEIATGNIQPSEHNIEAQWMADFYLYQKLYEHQDLISSAAIYQNFYSAKSSTPIGSFAPVRTGMGGLFRLNSTDAQELGGYEQTMDEKISEISIIDEQLPDATGNDLIQLMSDRAAAVQELETAASDFESLSNSIATARSNTADSLLAANNAIAVSRIYEQNEKTVNTVFLSTIGKEIYSLTEGQKTDLMAVASQCPYTGGIAVFRARNLLTTLDGPVDYDDDVLCQSNNFGGNPPVLAAGYKPGIMVYPNPAKDRLNVELVQALEKEGNLTFYNAFGREVLTQLLQAETNSFIFEVDALPNGIYWMDIREGKNKVFGTRIVLIK